MTETIRCFHCGRPHKDYAGDGFCSVGCRAAGVTPLRELEKQEREEKQKQGEK